MGLNDLMDKGWVEEEVNDESRPWSQGVVTTMMPLAERSKAA